MAELLRVGAEIIRPEPDSHFRLRPCGCGYGDAVYTRTITRHGVEWMAGCLTCERCTRVWTIQHHAQIEWNGRERPTWERD